MFLRKNDYVYEGQEFIYESTANHTLGRKYKAKVIKEYPHHISLLITAIQTKSDNVFGPAIPYVRSVNKVDLGTTDFLSFV